MIILTHELLELVTDNNAFIVLVKSISKRASFQNNSCFPSLATMEKDTGLSKNTVIKACKWLRENGIIQIVKRQTKKGDNASNYYFIETDLIKVVGKLKTEIPVQNMNNPSSKYEQPLVQNMNTNHKSNLTTSSFNSKKVLEFFNLTFNKNLKSSISWEDNANYWLNVYSLDEIKQAISRLNHPKWWAKDKLSLEFLFKKENSKGKCDYIQQLLDLEEIKENKPIEPQKEQRVCYRAGRSDEEWQKAIEQLKQEYPEVDYIMQEDIKHI
jgi:DNA-binding transcriptional regulator YhcF (GntR family)